jgi:hypothetical protein
MARWEYRVDGGTPVSSLELDRAGRDGWELVAIVPLNGGFSAVCKRPGY